MRSVANIQLWLMGKMLSNICLWAPSTILRGGSSIWQLRAPKDGHVTSNSFVSWETSLYMSFQQQHHRGFYTTTSTSRELLVQHCWEAQVSALRLRLNSTREQGRTREPLKAVRAKAAGAPGAREAAQGGQGLLLCKLIQHCMTMQHHHSCILLQDIPYSSPVKGSYEHKEQGIVLWLHKLYWAAAFI